MAVLYGNDAFSVVVLSTKKRYPTFLKQAIERVWNLHLLSHKNMPISQTEGYFENPWYRILEEPVFFLLGLRWSL